MNTIEEKFNELLDFYGNALNIEEKFKISKDNFTDNNILSMFDQHCKENSVEIEIEELFKNYANKKIYINSFDGYNEIIRLFQKEMRTMYEIKTDKSSIRCSHDHLIEYNYGFIYAGSLEIHDNVKTEYGQEKIKYKKQIESSIVYDFEVNHPNHTYFAGGFSNHNSGKTFLALNLVKEAQKQGYKILWVDSENAIDDETFKRFNINLDEVIYFPVNTISDLSTYLVNMVDALIEAKSLKKEIDKYLVIIDSIGNLSTDKEVKDVQSGSDKADMTRAKDLKRLFRVCTKKLGQLKIPAFITNHIYANVGGYGEKTVIGGGSGATFNSSIIIELFKAQLKEDGADKPKTGIVVTSKLPKSRMTKSNIPIMFHISLIHGMNPYVGLERYINWERCGIGYGKIEKGEFKPSATGRTIAVKHLGKHIPSKQLYTPQVFTKEILELLDPLAAGEFNLPPSNLAEYDLDAFLPDIEDDDEEIIVDTNTGEILND